MKKYLVLLLIMALGFMSNAQTTTTAPKKHKKHTTVKKRVEKVVINNTDSKTVVEIKNDKIYVNGEVVSTIKNAKNEDHKIVINHKHKSHREDSGEEAGEQKEKPEGDNETTLDGKSNSLVVTDKPFDREPNTAHANGSHNALLGVYTNPNAPVDGAYVSGTIENSPAKEAGIGAGDIIIKVNEMTIHSGDELVATIGTFRPGDNVIVTYIRNGNTEQARVSLGNKKIAEQNIQLQQEPDNNQWQNNQGNNENWNNEQENRNDDRGDRMFSYRGHFRGPHPVRLGISASDGRRPRGVYLDEVKPGSPAEAAGLQKGDIITRINGQRIRYAFEMQILLSYPGIGNIIDIDYRHDGEKMKTQVHIDDNRDQNDNNDQNYNR